jgi:hypothetical protein
MALSDPRHSSFRFPYDFLGRVHRAFEGSYSLVCSPRKLGEGQEDENGSIERGKLGRLHPWRAHGRLGPYYLLVLVIACRRAHLWRRAHT